MTTLFRPVGLDELSLIWDSGMKEFPSRLSHQPIFYPVTNVEYATQIALDWNTKDGSLAGYVTKFEIADSYISGFQPHTVGSALHKEYWIPAERLADFNASLQGAISVHSAYFGRGFQGFVPEHGALQGKDALAQFTAIAKLLKASRADFVEEVGVNSKLVYLNFLFWVQCDCTILGTNEEQRFELMGAIRQAWKCVEIPLPASPDEVTHIGAN